MKEGTLCSSKSMIHIKVGIIEQFHDRSMKDDMKYVLSVLTVLVNFSIVSPKLVLDHIG